MNEIIKFNDFILSCFYFVFNLLEYIDLTYFQESLVLGVYLSNSPITKQSN